MRVTSVVFAILLSAVAVAAQDELPVLESTRPVVSIRDGETLRRDGWQLAPQVSPDVYEAELQDGAPHTVTFFSDVGSLSFVVEEGKSYDFLIQYGDALCVTRIIGIRAIPAAVFDEAYRRANRGTITVEVPEVYELVNVALAMTPTALADPNLVYKKSPYYEEVRRRFDPYRDRPAVAALDEELKKRLLAYNTLKMDAYAFEFDEDGTIVQSSVYDHTAYPEQRRSSLRPFIPALQAFADASTFRAFYRDHRALYARQISFYRDEAAVAEMLTWLGRRFPAERAYDGTRIVFSPLVAYYQSATWVESNGYRELHAHVNFPYPADVKRMIDGSLSPKAETLVRSATVFTELNHGYINPEAERYNARILDATRDRDRWVDPARGADYYGGTALFNEYMNWGLVSLRIVDALPAAEQQPLIAAIDAFMTRRGFLQFAAFDAFLVELYRGREERTIADLYPQIIAWFEESEARSARPEP